jgi:hypothetical protein
VETELRFNHSEYGASRCGDTRGRLYVRRVFGGELQFCHNCGYKRFVPTGKRTPQEIMDNARQLTGTAEEATIESRAIQLPYDFTTTLPTKAQVWLARYHITEQESSRCGMGYSNYLSRLIMPVRAADGSLTYWQGRNLGEVTQTNPKYLNVRNKGAKNVFFRVRNDSESAYRSALCIVEDILSAIKVGRVCNSLALLGSYFPKELTQSELCKSSKDSKESGIPLYDKLFIWLDEDKYLTSLKEARHIKTLTPLVVRVVRTKKDPKEYNDEEIRRILSVN